MLFLLYINKYKYIQDSIHVTLMHETASNMKHMWYYSKNEQKINFIFFFDFLMGFSEGRRK